MPVPPSVRDFYAFERHVAAGARLRGGEIAPHWYEAPAFYFSNPASILGPGEPLRPAGGDADARLRARDRGRDRASAPGERGRLGIAGFTLMNDWSARDVQAAEMTVGLGPAKAKDFGTSLGPWLVTPDELPYEDGRLQLEARVEVNGEQVAGRSRRAALRLARDRRARRARHAPAPGDVLGSGTLAGGCLLELGPLPADGRAGGPLDRARRRGRARGRRPREPRNPGPVGTLARPTNSSRMAAERGRS